MKGANRISSLWVDSKAETCDADHDPWTLSQLKAMGLDPNDPTDLPVRDVASDVACTFMPCGGGV